MRIRCLTFVCFPTQYECSCGHCHRLFLLLHLLLQVLAFTLHLLPTLCAVCFEGCPKVGRLVLGELRTLTRLDKAILPACLHANEWLGELVTAHPGLRVLNVSGCWLHSLPHMAMPRLQDLNLTDCGDLRLTADLLRHCGVHVPSLTSCAWPRPDASVTEEILLAWLKSVPKLCRLSLVGPSPPIADSWSDALLAALGHLKLESLHLASMGSGWKKWEFFATAFMNDLSLEAIPTLTPVAMRQILKAAPRLRTLRLVDLKQPTDALVGVVGVEAPPQLSNITLASMPLLSMIGWSQFVSRLARQLTRLTVANCDLLDDQAVLLLRESNPPVLSQLTIALVDLTHAGLYRIAEDCQQLRILDIRGCPRLTEKCLLPIVASKFLTPSWATKPKAAMAPKVAASKGGSPKRPLKPSRAASPPLAVAPKVLKPPTAHVKPKKAVAVPTSTTASNSVIAVKHSSAPPAPAAASPSPPRAVRPTPSSKPPTNAQAVAAPSGTANGAGPVAKSQFTAPGPPVIRPPPRPPLLLRKIVLSTNQFDIMLDTRSELEAIAPGLLLEQRGR
jgi:hypothetical protein